MPWFDFGQPTGGIFGPVLRDGFARSVSLAVEPVFLAAYGFLRCDPGFSLERQRGRTIVRRGAAGCHIWVHKHPSPIAQKGLDQARNEPR